MQLAKRLVLGTSLIVALGWAPFACSSTPPLPRLSPATQEALVVVGIGELRDRCTALFADGDPPASQARDACLVLAAIDRGLMALEPAPNPSGSVPPTTPETSASPAPEPTQDAGLAVTPGNAVRSVP